MKPILKWVGGKAWLVDELVRRMPKKVKGRYYEPFAGGAALFFHLEPKNAVLGDMNEHVINTYRSIFCRRVGVDVALEDLAKAHNKRHYYATRAFWNRTFWSQTPLPPLEPVGPQWPKRAAMFLYLNRTCFNGLWRENRQGKMNVPMGRYKNPRIYDPDRLVDAYWVFQRSQADLRVGPFWQTVMDAKKGDFVYMDPPYDPISATSSFVSYGRDHFGRDEQKKLAEVVDELGEKGVDVMLSNSNTRWVRDTYRGLNVQKVYRPGSMNSATHKRGKVAELLITNY